MEYMNTLVPCWEPTIKINACGITSNISLLIHYTKYEGIGAVGETLF